MAAITDSSRTAGPFNPTKVILGASDTLVFTQGSGQELIMYNITGSAVTVKIDGAGGTTVSIPGTGGVTYSIAAGLDVIVPANGFTMVELDKIPAYLNGAVTATGGTGVIACIVK